MKDKERRIEINLKMPIDRFIKFCEIIKEHDEELWLLLLPELKKQIPEELQTSEKHTK